jgi:hypothetical protein
MEQARKPDRPQKGHGLEVRADAGGNPVGPRDRTRTAGPSRHDSRRSRRAGAKEFYAAEAGVDRGIAESRPSEAAAIPRLDSGPSSRRTTCRSFGSLRFYPQDPEIAPGPPMVLHGRVHTDGNLYRNAGDSQAIEDFSFAIPTLQVSAAGSVIRGRLDAPSCSGRVSVDRISDGMPLDLPCNGDRPSLPKTRPHGAEPCGPVSLTSARQPPISSRGAAASSGTVRTVA